MPRRTALVAGALVAALLAAPPAAPAAPASATPEAAAAQDRRGPLVRTLEFELHIRGRQRVNWQYATRRWGDDDAFWRHGSGEQLASYRTVTPMRVIGGDARDMPRLPGVGKVAPLSLAVSRDPRIAATVSRISAVTDHSPPPACEGCGPLPSRTAQLPQSCGKRKLDLAFEYTGFRYYDGKLALIPRVAPGSRPYEHCAPDAGLTLMGTSKSLLGDGLFWVDDIKGVNAVFGLRRRGSLTLSGTEHSGRGRCRLPSPPNRGEFAMCLWTDVTLTFTRVR